MSILEPKRILCPVDFSDQSAASLQVAGVIAQSFGSEVVVLHLQRLEAPVYFTVAQTQALRGQLRRSVRAARKHTGEFARKYLPEGVAQRVTVMEEDDVVDTIFKTQDEMGADLIAMGTHGRGGLARVRLGSIAESVLHQAQVPILTVGPRVKLTPTREAIRRVLCPVNYSPSSQAALEHAATLAVKTGAELTVAHIEEDSVGKNEQASVEQLCNWVPANIRAHCAVKEVVKQGSAAEQIVEEAEKSHADLLVIGAQPRSLLGAVLLGSTTDLVIRSAACPVVSVIGKK